MKPYFNAYYLISCGGHHCRIIRFSVKLHKVKKEHCYGDIVSAMLTFIFDLSIENVDLLLTIELETNTELFVIL